MRGPKIELGLPPADDNSIDGGGIQLKGNSDKEILWRSLNNKWNISHGLELTNENSTISMGSTDVLTKNTVLGNNITTTINVNSPSVTTLPTESAVYTHVDNVNLQKSKEVEIQSYFISQMLG